eukprot:584827-Rhodomonas_salina.2
MGSHLLRAQEGRELGSHIVRKKRFGPVAIEEAEKEDPLAKEGILEGLAGLLPPGPLGRPLEYIWEIS